MEIATGVDIKEMARKLKAFTKKERKDLKPEFERLEKRIEKIEDQMKGEKKAPATAPKKENKEA
jgi:polyhydroxyalkanoate synthesis regulator phasin